MNRSGRQQCGKLQIAGTAASRVDAVKVDPSPTVKSIKRSTTVNPLGIP
jgi:hypothetical protein